MIHAIVLAAATAPCGGDLNQADLDVCWLNQANKADAALNVTYAKVKAGLHSLQIDPDPLVGIQLAWISTRDKTCDFEESLEEGGSIAPMMNSECVDRMTRARTARLDNVMIAYQNGEVHKLQPVSPAVDKELNRVYGLLYKYDLSASSHKKLIASETAWIAYRDKACAFEGGTCLTDLERERTKEFEDGWLGEQFW